MPEVQLPQLNRVLQVETGANLMRALLKAGIPVASSCNGDCVCGKCKLEVHSLSGDLPEAKEDEKFLIQKLKISPGFRLSCQIHVFADLKVTSRYW